MGLLAAASDVLVPPPSRHRGRTQRLREGLSRARSAANDATMASALIRPDRHAERVREALARVRAALNAATEAVADVKIDGGTAWIDGVCCGR